jgi:plastocyanin
MKLSNRVALGAAAMSVAMAGAPSASLAAQKQAAVHRSAAAKPQVASKPIVTIENFSFAPGKIVVKAGTTVTWTNGDDIPHSVVATGGVFRSKVLDTGDSFTFTFVKPGTYGYYCGLHPHMVGQVIVTS